jgi:hypothetical protein
MAFLENKLHEYGVVDIFKNRWPFERWHTSDDAANWSLVSDGQPVRVSCQTMALETGAPVCLFHTIVLSRWFVTPRPRTEDRRPVFLRAPWITSWVLTKL